MLIINLIVLLILWELLRVYLLLFMKILKDLNNTIFYYLFWSNSFRGVIIYFLNLYIWGNREERTKVMRKSWYIWFWLFLFFRIGIRSSWIKRHWVLFHLLFRVLIVNMWVRTFLLIFWINLLDFCFWFFMIMIKE